MTDHLKSSHTRHGCTNEERISRTEEKVDLLLRETSDNAAQLKEIRDSLSELESVSRDSAQAMVENSRIVSQLALNGQTQSNDILEFESRVADALSKFRSEKAPQSWFREAANNVIKGLLLAIAAVITYLLTEYAKGKR